MKNPLVSVIVPCYNVAAYVGKALESILAQTYTNLEIWIVDDGSTDGTLNVVKGYDDARIIVKAFSQNRQKVGAVNEVLALVNGDYVCFQDADDWSEPSRIEEQVTLMEQETALGICFTGYRFFGNEETSQGHIAITNQQLRKEFLEYEQYPKGKGWLPTLCATMMIRKSVLLQTKGYHTYFAGGVAEDVEWIYRILKSFKGETISKPLYTYNIREGSLSQVQASGTNARYLYSWSLLSKIIYADQHKNIDLLAPENESLLKRLELETCEDALLAAVSALGIQKEIYERSMSYRIGRLILSPWRMFKEILQRGANHK